MRNLNSDVYVVKDQITMNRFKSIAPEKRFKQILISHASEEISVPESYGASFQVVGSRVKFASGRYIIEASDNAVITIEKGAGKCTVYNSSVFCNGAMRVLAYDKSFVSAVGPSRVIAHDYTKAFLAGEACCEARDFTEVCAFDLSRVYFLGNETSGTLHDAATAEVCEAKKITACGDSRVYFRNPEDEKSVELTMMGNAMIVESEFSMNDLIAQGAFEKISDSLISAYIPVYVNKAGAYISLLNDEIKVTPGVAYTNLPVCGKQDAIRVLMEACARGDGDYIPAYTVLRCEFEPNNLYRYQQNFRNFSVASKVRVKETVPANIYRALESLME